MIFWAIFILIQLISLGFCILSLSRLFHYLKKHAFIESSYTMLFKFIRVEHIAVAYVIAILAWILGITSFTFYIFYG